jgi:dipeptidyl aminopeptidase/acylaminoacyl peptidase
MFAFALSLLAAVAQPRPFTIDDEMKLRSIVDVRISPDGEQVAYVVSTPNLAKNEHEGALYIVNTRGGDSSLRSGFKIFNKPRPAPQLRWSPDSKTIALLGMTDTGPQVIAVPRTGAASRALTEAPEGASAFEWSPDGKSIAYLTTDPTSKEKPMVIHADAPGPPARLVVRAIDGPARTLSPPSHYVESFSWMPDGSEIAYAASTKSGFSAQYDTRIYAIAAGGGTPHSIVDRAGMNGRPLVSPDGRMIAFVSTNGRTEIMAPRSLAVVPTRGGPPRMLQSDGTWIAEFAWAPNSKSIYYGANEGTFASGAGMFEQPIIRIGVEAGFSRPEPVKTGSNTVNYSVSVSADGRRLAYRSVDGRTMGDVFVLDTATGRATKLTDVNPELHDLALGDLKAVKWRSFDGMEIWGLLLTPPGWTSGKVPMIVYCHGGPVGGVTYGLFPQFMHTIGQVDFYPTEAMASAGFAILFPMPRGGSGYGEAGMRMIVNAWGEGDYRDIMAGVDEMVRRGIADPDRLGVMGASYGGYMTSWIVTQTNRFKAASTGASVNDLADEYYLSDTSEVMAEYFRRPWENRESYTAHSPLTFAERVTTPLLIQHGENDRRVPIAGAWKFYRALKALGKIVEFDIHPRGSHVLFEPLEEREQMERNLQWFTRWLK